MIKIAVSACLMGHNVRYNGKNKRLSIEHYLPITDYHLTPLCPETAMGLSVPRPPIELITRKGTIHLVQVNDHSIDHTFSMQTWFEKHLPTIIQYSGLVLKNRSPSCGHKSANHYKSDGSFVIGDGLFVQLIKHHCPDMAIICEQELKKPQLLKKFIKRVSETRI